MSMSTAIVPARSDLDLCWYLRKQGRLGDLLERALHDIGVLHPGGWADWHPSTMTDTGAPVEMQFSADSAALSLRTEVADPASDPATRISAAYRMVRRFGQTPPPAALRDVISAAQGDAKLRYGAWLGLRSNARQLGCTIYAELPESGADLTGLMVSHRATDALVAMGDDIRLTMLGYDCLTGQITLFGDTAVDAAAIVPALAKIADVPAAPVLHLINQLYDAGTAGRHDRLGFCLTITPGVVAPALLVQLAAKQIFPCDDTINRLVSAYPSAQPVHYASLAEMLPPAPQGRVHHGQIGLKASHDAPPILSIGVAAPWQCTAAPI